MEKIRLEIIGMSYSQSQSGAYALILGERDGKRKLPIIIGGFEAQAIAIELEKIKTPRPLTHDLFKSFAEAFNIRVSEIIVNKFHEGVFYAVLICSDSETEIEIDSRTSDAIALALRFNCPIYTYENIMVAAGIVMEEGRGENLLKKVRCHRRKKERNTVSLPWRSFRSCFIMQWRTKSMKRPPGSGMR